MFEYRLNGKPNRMNDINPQSVFESIYYSYPCKALRLWQCARYTQGYIKLIYYAKYKNSRNAA